MNLEQLSLNVFKIWSKISQKSKKKLLLFLKINYYLLNWKRNKLKLGSIIFEIKELYVGNFLIHEEIDIRYIRQDNTKTDEMKFENRLKKLNWKFDFNNVAAFCIVVSIIITYLYNIFFDFFSVYYFYFKTINQSYNFFFLFLFKISFNGFFIKKIYLENNFLLFEKLFSFFFI